MALDTFRVPGAVLIQPVADFGVKMKMKKQRDRDVEILLEISKSFGGGTWSRAIEHAAKELASQPLANDRPDDEDGPGRWLDEAGN